MTDPPPETPQPAPRPGRPRAATPRWVKVFGLIALMLVLVVIVLLLAGGDHGPGRHF